MKLVIHDLNETKWQQISSDFKDSIIISDNGSILPCSGCFSCWNRTPGECIIHDGYQDMGRLIHEAQEVIVVSRYTFGGFSSFVKNVFDRSLAYVLPQFEVVNNETHHQKRYDEDKPFTFIFYGHELSDEQKETARKYVKAVCANIRGFVKEVIFKEGEEITVKTERSHYHNQKTVLLNVSMRYKQGNTAKLCLKLRQELNNESQIINLQEYTQNKAELMKMLEDVSILVLCMPLYVDGLPSQLIRFMEEYSREYQGKIKKIYVLANMGLYESSQLSNLFAMVKEWCKVMSFEYGGGLGVSAGELIGVLMQHLPFNLIPMNRIASGMKKLAQAINKAETIEDIYTEPFMFPRSLYILIANKSWNNTAKKYGLKPSDLYRQL